MRIRLIMLISALLLCFAIAPVGAGKRRGAPAPAPAAPQSGSFVLVMHGGAGSYTDATPERLEPARAAITKALEAGRDILARGGSSLDAVEAAQRVMEDSGVFDAGRGAYYTRDGVPEMDAAIMDGRTLAAGAVASVQHIAHPISLARMVMERTKHVLLVGPGAEEFAKSQGIALVSPYYFFNERRWKSFQEKQAAEEKPKAGGEPPNEIYGTTGALALDKAGNLAAATTTGGTTYKMPGRVGDSPLIGAGTYANNESCAVSGTGVGEYFIRNVVAADICARVKYLHVSLEQAANDVVMKELVEQHGEGGVIALDRAGHVATPFNTHGMMHGVVRSDGNITIETFKP
jgi:beta-aspartyl-peptidase (threonine type)